MAAEVLALFSRHVKKCLRDGRSGAQRQRGAAGTGNNEGWGGGAGCGMGGGGRIRKRRRTDCVVVVERGCGAGAVKREQHGMPDSLRGERGVNDEEAGEEVPGAAVEEDGRDGGLARGVARGRGNPWSPPLHSGGSGVGVGLRKLSGVPEMATCWEPFSSAKAY